MKNMTEQLNTKKKPARSIAGSGRNGALWVEVQGTYLEEE